MFHMQLVSLDTADAHAFDAAGPVTPPTAPTPCTILMTVRLPEGTQLTVFVSNLTLVGLALQGVGGPPPAR